MATYSFPWNQVNALVQDYILPSIRDQFFKSNAFYYRAQNRLKMYAGGRAIVVPLSWKAEGNGGGWWSGTDTLDVTVRDPIQAAVHTAKNAYVPIAIDWDEEKMVQGPTMVKSLIEAKSELAKTTIIDLVGTDLFNAGTNPKAITGLQYVLKDWTYVDGATDYCTAQTYGGIARGGATLAAQNLNNPWWMHQGDPTAYVDNSNFRSTTAGEVIAVLNKMWTKIGIASAKQPTMMLSNWGIFGNYHNALVLNDRYMRPQQNSDMAKAGYENLMFKKAIWCVDERAPRSSAKVEKLYFINEDTMRLFVHQDANMAFEPFRKPVDQMTRVAYILWRGEQVCIEPRANGVISSIDCSHTS